MSSKLSSLSVFFPCLNEEQNIPDLIKTVDAFLPLIAKQYEMIVVDDGSTDSTAHVLVRLQLQYPKLHVITHPTNKGYGAALRSGIKAAKYDWIFWTDGDLQFDISNLKTFLAFTPTHDAIIGYRAHRADTFIRKVNGELYTDLINLLFHLRVRDIDCAFKLVRATPLQSLTLATSSAFTSAEILIKLKQAKVSLKQLPVTHYPRKKGSPTGGNIRVIFKGLWQAFDFYLQSLR